MVVLDIPRVVGVTLLAAAVMLQGIHVAEIKQIAESKEEELRYRAKTIYV